MLGHHITSIAAMLVALVTGSCGSEVRGKRQYFEEFFGLVWFVLFTFGLVVVA